MAITFVCVCGQTLRFADQAAGKPARCRKCGAAVRVPGADELLAIFYLEDEPAPDRAWGGDDWRVAASGASDGPGDSRKQGVDPPRRVASTKGSVWDLE